MSEDSLAKSGLESLLLPFVEVRSQEQVDTPSQYVDLFVSQEPSKPEAMIQALGLLGRMALNPALLEAFSDVVSEHEARACQRKQLVLHHSLELNAAVERAKPGARAVKSKAVPLPALWLISVGRPTSFISSWELRRDLSWPEGFYRTPVAQNVWLVVLTELPKTRETLCLRLFGDERTRIGLREEWQSLSHDDALRVSIERLILRWGVWLGQFPDDEEAKRWMMNFQEIVQEEIQKIHDKGKEDGLRIGKEDGLRIGKEDGLRIGKEDGLREGEAKGLREGIQALCLVLSIALTPEQESKLNTLNNQQLKSLKDILIKQRAWPDFHETTDVI